MNYDYQDSQVEVTYLLGANNDRTLKKALVGGEADAGAASENRLFEAHMSGMTGDGWALVSIAATPEATVLSAPYKRDGVPRSQTSSYHFSWKRLKLV
jgi:hypothetical protein